MGVAHASQPESAPAHSDRLSDTRDFKPCDKNIRFNFASKNSLPLGNRRVRRLTNKGHIVLRLALFKTAVQQLFRSERANSLPLARITAHLSETYAHAPFTTDEVRSAIETMTSDNQLMCADDMIFLI